MTIRGSKTMWDNSESQSSVNRLGGDHTIGSTEANDCDRVTQLDLTQVQLKRQNIPPLYGSLSLCVYSSTEPTLAFKLRPKNREYIHCSIAGEPALKPSCKGGAIPGSAYQCKCSTLLTTVHYCSLSSNSIIYYAILTPLHCTQHWTPLISATHLSNCRLYQRNHILDSPLPHIHKPFHWRSVTVALTQSLTHWAIAPSLTHTSRSSTTLTGPGVKCQVTKCHSFALYAHSVLTQCSPV